MKRWSIYLVQCLKQESDFVQNDHQGNETIERDKNHLQDQAIRDELTCINASWEDVGADVAASMGTEDKLCCNVPLEAFATLRLFLSSSISINSRFRT
jgi:hypothetical protein